jgi:hypothetical protein
MVLFVIARPDCGADWRKKRRSSGANKILNGKRWFRVENALNRYDVCGLFAGDLVGHGLPRGQRCDKAFAVCSSANDGNEKRVAGRWNHDWVIHAWGQDDAWRRCAAGRYCGHCGGRGGVTQGHNNRRCAGVNQGNVVVFNVGVGFNGQGG